MTAGRHCPISIASAASPAPRRWRSRCCRGRRTASATSIPPSSPRPDGRRQALVDRRVAEAFPALGEAPLAALDRVHGTGEPCRARGDRPAARPALAILRTAALGCRGLGGARRRRRHRRRAGAAARRDGAGGAVGPLPRAGRGRLAGGLDRRAGRRAGEVPSWDGLTGQTSDHSAGLGWLDAIHPEDRAAGAPAGWRRSQRRDLRGGVPPARPDGGWRWTAARAVPRRDAAGPHPRMGRRQHRYRGAAPGRAGLRPARTASGRSPRRCRIWSGRPTPRGGRNTSTAAGGR